MVSERTVADLKAKLAERDRKIDALTAETTTLRRCIGEMQCKCVFAEDGSVFNECDRCTILRIAGKPAINGTDVLAERDRRIAELEAGLNRIGVSIAVSGTGGVVMDEMKALDLIDALTKRRSLAPLTCSTGYCSCAAKTDRITELEAALKDCIWQIQALCSHDDVPTCAYAALSGKGVSRG